VRALSFGAAIAAASALVADPMTAEPAVGRVEGVVRLVAPTDPPIVSGAYPSRRVSRPAPRASEISNVIVFIKDAPRALALAATRARMMQQDEAFVPHVVAITRGSTVEFPNADPYFHNVFSMSPAPRSTWGAIRVARAVRTRSTTPVWSRSTATSTRI
jgi:plastocyanin